MLLCFAYLCFDIAMVNVADLLCQQFVFLCRKCSLPHMFMQISYKLTSTTYILTVSMWCFQCHGTPRCSQSILKDLLVIH